MDCSAQQGFHDPLLDEIATDTVLILAHPVNRAELPKRVFIGDDAQFSAAVEAVTLAQRNSVSVPTSSRSQRACLREAQKHLAEARRYLDAMTRARPA